MTKAEKIKEAYGTYWEAAKDYVDENGWCSVRKKIMFDELKVNLEIHTNGYYHRPKSIEGIENNNGWIKIESETDLPKTDLECYVTNNIGRIQFGEFEAETQRFFVNDTRTFPTHYIPVVKPIFPIY